MSSMEREQIAISGKPTSGAVLDRPMADLDDGAGRMADAPEVKRSIFRKAWDGWMRFAEMMGTVNLVIILSIMYWTMVAVIAIPFKLASDPLRIKTSEGHGWVVREPFDTDLESMRNQY